jgi:hypothetical protein
MPLFIELPGGQLPGNRAASLLVLESRRLLSGTTRVQKGLPKGPDIFLDCLERPVYVEPLDEHAHVVAFRVGLRALVQAFEPVAHQLRLAQILDHPLLSRYRLLSRSLHNSHLPIDHRAFILRSHSNVR